MNLMLVYSQSFSIRNRKKNYVFKDPEIQRLYCHATLPIDRTAIHEQLYFYPFTNYSQSI